ncbi:hypothetical protein GEMRC1_005802 [Eukaryota sp. GEM-RC1]
MQVIALALLTIAFVTACNFSCFQSSCRTSGGINNHCNCDPFVDKGTTIYHAFCTATGATSCEKTDGRTGCSIEGTAARCKLTGRTSGATTWYFSDCSATNAPRCSQTLFDSNCEIIGENSWCYTEFLNWKGNTWFVPQCRAQNALQCSIKCGSSSCNQDCTGTGKGAACNCRVISTSHEAILTARCVCL